MGRILKQLFVFIVFFSILGALGFGAYRFFVPAKPTPTPNPTATLPPLEVVSYQLIPIKNNDYDFIAKIRNPNTEYGSGNVLYTINFFDAVGQTVGTRNGSLYILPGQTKHLIISPVRLTGTAVTSEVKIRSVAWEKLSMLAIGGTNLSAKNTHFDLINRSGVYAAVSGTIFNPADFDFDIVDVAVITYDTAGRVLAVGKTDVRTFLARTERGFQVSFPQPFPPVARFDVEVATNLFNNLNFIQSNGGHQERFQQLY